MISFGDFLRADYSRLFDPNAPYVSVASIEQEYARLPNADISRRNAVFVNWIDDEDTRGFPCVSAAYDVLTSAFNWVDDPIEKLERLVAIAHGTGSMITHPLVAMLFALQITPEFALHVLGRTPTFLAQTTAANARAAIDALNNVIDEKNRMIADLAKQLADSKTALHAANQRADEYKRENQRLAADLAIANTSRITVCCARMRRWLCCGRPKRERIGSNYNHLFPL